SYLPKPGSAEYQFVYVDAADEVCARSSPFSFCAPKPLDDLVTLEQVRDGGEEGEDILLVVPRAELLQNRLEECLRERAEFLQVREIEEKMMKREQEMRERAEKVWEKMRSELENKVTELKEELRQNKEEMEHLESKLQKGQSLLEAMTAERDSLSAEGALSQQNVRELEDDIKALRQRGEEKESELEKMKERVRKMSLQRKEEEEERRSLQMEAETAVGELRCVRERLDASEHTVESLRAELCDAAAQRDHGQAELHQARLQAAQLTLQLADAGLALREGRASWAQEREALRNSAEMEREKVQKLSREVQRKEEWLQEERMEREKVEVELGKERDCSRAQLSEVKRELQELRARLRDVQKERERNLLEKQDLMEYIRQLEQRLEAVADAKWSEAALNASSRPSSPSASSEDENPEALQGPRPTGQLVTYSLCSPSETEMLVFLHATKSSRDPSQGTQVVMNQPAPVSSPRQPEDDTLNHSSESEGEEQYAGQSGAQNSEEETALLLPDHKDTTFSEFADTPLW
ncbi:hypothetical protein GJAV_G00177180, partial [Gymnothorax javanicus]